MLQLKTVGSGTDRIEDAISRLKADGEGFGTLLLGLLVQRQNNPTSPWIRLQVDIATELYNDKSSREIDQFAVSISEHRRQILQTKFLHHLRYDGIKDREERIAKAHQATFQWIFETDEMNNKKWSNFKDWLESDSQLYWMTGKAGSGKSTLMKFICKSDPDSPGEEPRCWKYLKRWAADSHLIIATFFFWTSGFAMQMTQRGLFQSLLSQILQQLPQLIPVVSPRLWESLCLLDGMIVRWVEQDLQQMFRLVMQNLPSSTKLCMFVDGLDEFDGDHKTLIRLFRDGLRPNVKLCVSSRPWTVFEDAFQHSPSLMLQDLTYGDIKRYVSCELYQNPSFSLLREREEAYADQLVENVVSKASGVFLWVRLVVASLLAGIGYGDRVDDLQRRLDLLPPEMELLYDKMLQSLDPFYLEHAAELFKLVRQSPRPPSILLLSFADEEDWGSVFTRPIQSLSSKEASIRVDTMRRRLNSRCKGFLEAPEFTDPRGRKDITRSTVQYIHRTAKDFLESQRVQIKLKSALKSSFDPHLRLCAGNLALLKVIGRDDLADTFIGGTFGLSEFWNRVDMCMYSAAKIAPENRHCVIPLMKELDETGCTHATDFLEPQKSATVGIGSSDNLDHSRVELFELGQWVHTSLSIFSTHGLGHFLSLAVLYGITEYVEAQVDEGCLVQKVVPDHSHTTRRSRTHCQIRTHSLLLDAVTTKELFGLEFLLLKELDGVPDPAMVALLLRKGADPDAAADDSRTVWENMIENKELDIKRVTSNSTEAPQDLIARWKSVEDMMRQKREGSSKRQTRDTGPVASSHRRFSFFTRAFNLYKKSGKEQPRPEKK